MKTRRIFNCQEGCPVESTIQFISGKWKSVILYHLLTNERCRFGELSKKIPGCAPRMLARQLAELEKDHLIVKNTYSVKPTITDYQITEFGQSLRSVIMAMAQWGEQFNQEMADKSVTDD